MPNLLVIAALAQQVRENRRPAPDDNPGCVAERQVSDAVTRILKDFGVTRDRATEKLFQTIYDSPAIQMLTGVAGGAMPPRQRPGATAEHRRFVEQAIADLARRVASGGEREAMVRAGLYVGIAEIPDERAFAVLRRIRAQLGEVSLAQFKALLREQFFMLHINEHAALAALPKMLAKGEAQPRRAYEIVRAVTTATGEATPEALARLKALAPIFGVDPNAPMTSPAIIAETRDAEVPVGTPTARRKKSGES